MHPRFKAGIFFVPKDQPKYFVEFYCEKKLLYLYRKISIAYHSGLAVAAKKLSKAKCFIQAPQISRQIVG